MYATIPPVTRVNTCQFSTNIVEATVVAPIRLVAIISAKSRRDTLATSSCLASNVSSSVSKPILIFPLIKATVAGLRHYLIICSTF